jgi:6,7-dimethyl-8-ribityllumazine synthase
MKYTIVVAEFNKMITEAMLVECLNGFEEQGIEPEVVWAPGAVELIYTIQNVIQNDKPDAIVALGCVIKGETDHYSAICDFVTKGVCDLTIKHHLPIVFEVLLVDSYAKAESRIDKAYHAAFVASRMANLND